MIPHGFHIASIHYKWVFLVTPFVFSLIGFYIYLIISRNAQIERAVREETGDHHLAKRHIPDMAGQVMIVLFAIALIVSLLLGDFPSGLWLLFPILFGILGLADDYSKNMSKNTKGIPARYRIVLQAIIGVGFLAFTYVFRYDSFTVSFLLLIGLFHLIFLLGTVNASNITDGLDGLLGGIAIIIALGFTILLIKTHNENTVMQSHDYLHLFISVLAAFLIFNRHPAKMFMGDGGSMLIGAFLACFAIWWKLELWLLFAAIPVYLELMSVVLQVIYFRSTGKRLFPITPIHHTFEKWGWNEKKIILLFYLATFLSVFIAFFVYSIILDYCRHNW